MSDEENEAIEWLKRLVKINKRDNLDDTFAEISLNLIEKQQKEIELLKEENEKYKNPPFFDEDKYTENDKIKAKIEEVDKDKYISNSDFIEFAEYARDYAKKALQSLLEKE